MTTSFAKIHEQFHFNGIHYNNERLKVEALKLENSGDVFNEFTGKFLTDWLNADDFLHANTSGSTGQPKRIKLYKQAMVNSALATGQFFDLKPGNMALNCLSSDYIAGKIMLVRAMVLGLHLDTIPPHMTPYLAIEKSYDFSAMVPVQIGLKAKKYEKIKTIIVGGSRIASFTLEDMKTSKTKFFETYGMTETVTHVALKPLESLAQNGEDYFKALPNVHFSLDERNCLIIDAPNLVKKPLITNDVVDLKSNTEFKWLGRYDNVVNSGGIKLFPEQIENVLLPIIKKPIIIASQPDAILGEKLILIIETSDFISDELRTLILETSTLTKYQKPKVIYNVPQFQYTSNGKIQRQKTIDLVLG